MKFLILSENAYETMFSALCNALSYAETFQADYEAETPMFALLQDEIDDATLALDYLQTAQEVE